MTGSNSIQGEQPMMYRVEVYSGATLLLTELVTASEFEFSIDKNIDANNQQSGGTTQVPYRALSIRVRVRDKFGRLSASDTTHLATNPSPNVSELAWTLTAGFRRGTITITQHPLDNDYVGCEVFISTSNDPPLVATRVGDILKGERVFHLDYMNNSSQLLNGTTYFVRLVPYDEFSIDLTNTTSGFTFVPVLSGVLAEELNAFQNIALGQSSAFGSDGFQAALDPYGNTGIPGFFCGSKTSERFIEFSEPVLGQAALRLGRDTELSGAKSYNNNAKYFPFINDLDATASINIGAGSSARINGLITQSNGLIDGNHYRRVMELNSELFTFSFTRNRRIKGVFNHAAVGRYFTFVTGEITNAVLFTGVYFGFRADGLNIHAVYNDGSGLVVSAAIGTITLLSPDELECISDTVAGTITYYVNNTLVHTFAINTSGWTNPIGQQALWDVSLMHSGTTGVQTVRWGIVDFLEDSA